MSTIAICDLCGKPLELDGDGARYFKVKEYSAFPFDFIRWRKIDCHADCLRKLLSTTEPPKEE